MSEGRESAGMGVRLALRQAETMARLAAPVMQLVAVVTRPLVWGMSTATSAVLFLLGALGSSLPLLGSSQFGDQVKALLLALEHHVLMRPPTE